MGYLLLRNFRSFEDHKIHSLSVIDGNVECIDCNKGKDGDVLDCQGKILVPPFVNSHAHLTIALTLGAARSNRSGTLIEGNEIYRDVLHNLDSGEFRRRLKLLSDVMFMRGILYVRSHDPPTYLKELLALRKNMPISIQEVVFPPPGFIFENTSIIENFLMDGAEVLGGIPHAEDTYLDGITSVRLVFEIASSMGKMVDFHVDETDDPDSRFASYAIKEAKRRDMCKRLTLSHITASHSYPTNYWDSIQPCGSVVLNPLTNSFLQGRYDNYPKRRGIARLSSLISKGFNVSLGTDNVQDSVFPLGDFNMIRVFHEMLLLEDWHEPEALLSTVTFNGAKVLGIEDYGYPRVERRAELVVLDCRDLIECNSSSMPFLVVRGKTMSDSKSSSLISTD